MSSRDESRIFDVRTLERNMRKGILSKKDVDKYIKSLPDSADKSTVCNPEAQGREPPEPVRHRPAVIATPAPIDDDEDDLLDAAGVDDDEDEDEDEDDEVEDEAETEKK